MFPILIGLDSLNTFQKGISISFFMPNQVVKKPIRVMFEIFFHDCFVFLKFGLALIDRNQIRVILYVLYHDLMFICGKSFGEEKS